MKCSNHGSNTHSAITITSRNSTQQHRAQTVASLLANMGGLIGLTLGASMITICEFAEILSVYCIKVVDKLKTSRLKKKKVSDG